MSDDDIIDVESSQELMPVGAPPATLFRTDEPGEIVARAVQVANALSTVLKEKKLTVRIGQKTHVLVEGWTLCGTMLGVFPVVEWTHKIDDGWEARVEARTRDGAVVGAAEAECLITEKRWKTADDYAVRSMAQTRAISKALRAPLGFIVSLAGFDPTPAEEMERDADSGPAPFNPEIDLMPDAIRGQDAPKRLVAALEAIEPTVEWSDLLGDMIQQKWGVPSTKDLAESDRADFWRRLSNAVQWIHQHENAGSFPPAPPQVIQSGFAFGFSGLTPEVPYKEPVGAPFTQEEAEAIQASLAQEDIPFPNERV